MPNTEFEPINSQAQNQGFQGENDHFWGTETNGETETSTGNLPDDFNSLPMAEEIQAADVFNGYAIGRTEDGRYEIKYDPDTIEFRDANGQPLENVTYTTAYTSNGIQRTVAAAIVTFTTLSSAIGCGAPTENIQNPSVSGQQPLDGNNANVSESVDTDDGQQAVENVGVEGEDNQNQGGAEATPTLQPTDVPEQYQEDTINQEVIVNFGVPTTEQSTGATGGPVPQEIGGFVDVMAQSSLNYNDIEFSSDVSPNNDFHWTIVSTDAQGRKIWAFGQDGSMHSRATAFALREGTAPDGSTINYYVVDEVNYVHRAIEGSEDAEVIWIGENDEIATLARGLITVQTPEGPKQLFTEFFNPVTQQWEQIQAVAELTAAAEAPAHPEGFIPLEDPRMANADMELYLASVGGSRANLSREDLSAEMLALLPLGNDIPWSQIKGFFLNSEIVMDRMGIRYIITSIAVPHFDENSQHDGYIQVNMPMTLQFQEQGEAVGDSAYTTNVSAINPNGVVSISTREFLQKELSQQIPSLPGIGNPPLAVFRYIHNGSYRHDLEGLQQFSEVTYQICPSQGIETSNNGVCYTRGSLFDMVILAGQ